MKAREYWHPDYTHLVPVDVVREADPDFQKEVMREWFFQHYEDPAQHTPYESKEGGYIYIWGGPYDAKEELEGEFTDIVPETVIDELIEELESQCVQWSGKPSASEFDDYFYSIISSNTEFHETFFKNLEIIESLLQISIYSDLEQQLLRLLYVNVIMALETFLSDAFINTVLGKEALLRKFVESNPDFEKRKLSVSVIFSRMEALEKEVRDYLLDMIWHNLEKVKPIYKATLDIDFPEDLKGLFKAIAIRHDIVHRNGKTKEGKEVKLERKDVEQLIRQAREFGEYIDDQFNKHEL